MSMAIACATASHGALSSCLVLDSHRSASHVGLRRSSLPCWSSKPAVALSAGACRYRAGQREREGQPITCEAARRGSDFEDQAGRIAEEARRRATDAAKAFSDKAGEVLNGAKRQAGEFSRESDVQGRVNRAAAAAGRKIEEIGFDMRRNASNWNRQFGISEKFQGAREFAAEQVENADRQLGIRRRARNFSTDLRVNWPTYRRRFINFLDTPIGKSFLTLCLVWLILSGWLFRILLLSMWILPLAGPLLLGALSRAAVVEGTCPACGQRYIGGRNQAVTCGRCRRVVWQPRQDFSKGASDPQIIDIDIEPQ